MERRIQMILCNNDLERKTSIVRSAMCSVHRWIGISLRLTTKLMQEKAIYVLRFIIVENNSPFLFWKNPSLRERKEEITHA